MAKRGAGADSSSNDPANSCGGGGAMEPNGKVRPRWDAERRELWLGIVLIKRFRRPAPVVELILAAFEEEGWPPHIDDPLAPRPDRREKDRLRQAVHALNRRLTDRQLIFETDGHGLGVCWSVRASSALFD